jgi:hypothetical protein
VRTSHSNPIPSGTRRWALRGLALLASVVVISQVEAASGAEPGQFNPNLTGIKLASFELRCPPGPTPAAGGPRCVHRQTRSSFRVGPADGSRPARKMRTAKDGRALVMLPPGTYRVRPLIKYNRHHRALGPAPAPQDVAVKADEFAAVIVDYEGDQPG